MNQQFCWGYNRYGQVGDGTFAHPQISPVQITLVRKKQRISPSYERGFRLSKYRTIHQSGESKAKVIRIK